MNHNTPSSTLKDLNIICILSLFLYYVKQMAVNKVRNESSLNIEVQKGVDTSGDPIFGKNTFSFTNKNYYNFGSHLNTYIISHNKYHLL